ncbi:hypothetical protein F2Q69_00055094 [Brassica cretica]|uniref:Uncharacterized protein n=1 Tax=Brassica cretica TaxID=69181 RepID=A0A8S9N0T8_BRACR|nr:hypothetical protein F2Q69_00055094 [Brassica cretica]
MREVWIDTLQAEPFDSVNQAPNDIVHHVSNDTIHLISNDTVHPLSNDTAHIGTIHYGTVHQMTTDTIQQASIDTTFGETKRVEVVILKKSGKSDVGSDESEREERDPAGCKRARRVSLEEATTERDTGKREGQVAAR